MTKEQLVAKITKLPAAKPGQNGLRFINNNNTLVFFIASNNAEQIAARVDLQEVEDGEEFWEDLDDVVTQWVDSDIYPPDEDEDNIAMVRDDLEIYDIAWS